MRSFSVSSEMAELAPGKRNESAKIGTLGSKETNVLSQPMTWQITTRHQRAVTNTLKSGSSHRLVAGIMDYANPSLCLFSVTE